MDAFCEIFEFWDTELQLCCQNSNSICVGAFDDTKQLRYANAGMMKVLGLSTIHGTPTNSFVNPTIDELFKREASCDPSCEPIFHGIMTIGNLRDIHYNLISMVWRKKNQMLVVGEYNIDELHQANKKMIALNQEINNLQRSLIKEKISLERALEELKETQAMLIHSQKMNALGQLAAGVAHEINNPIAFISSNLHSLGSAFSDIRHAFEAMETMIQSSGNSEWISKLNDIRKAYDIDFIFSDFDDLRNASLTGVQRVKKIVEDMRNFSRLDEAELKSVSMLENIQSAISLLQPELKKRQVQIHLDIDPSLMVTCYPSQFNQAVLNLILNSIQAIERNGRITIKVWQENNQTIFTFSDTGKGISPEIMDKIFNPFFTTKPVGQGTGLGLSLVYKIITDMHQGTIHVDSVVNQGTTITITIPMELTYYDSSK